MNYPNNVKAARMTAVRDLIDAGDGPGKLEIGTAGMATILVTVILNDPSGSVTNNVLTLLGFPKSVFASAGGIAAAARVRDSNNTDVITGLTVGTSGANVILDNLNLATDQNVVINSATFTHAA